MEVVVERVDEEVEVEDEQGDEDEDEVMPPLPVPTDVDAVPTDVDAVPPTPVLTIRPLPLTLVVTIFGFAALVSYPTPPAPASLPVDSLVQPLVENSSPSPPLKDKRLIPT